MMALVAWLVVRRSLRPLRLATAGIASLGFDNPGTRLPDDDRIPLELLPLIEGINRALDRLQDGFRRQQRFTANAAHEMRTPLAVLRARIDSLEPIAAQEELRRDAQRITALVDQMLAIARLRQNDDSFEDFDLGGLVAALTGDLAPLAIGADLQITYVPPARPVLVRGNRRAIESAVTNLIDNALHAEPAGGGIAVAVTEDGAVLVIDHGPGIVPEHRELVFEPFWRQDESRTGTGLGLGIVREIAELHGGTVQTTQTHGGGATFRITLPVLRD
jgi:signal transduction histidine kinase